MSVFYQSEVVELLPSGDAGSLVTIPTLQSVGMSFNVNRNNSSRLGKFSLMPYRPAFQTPTVNLQVDFIPTGRDVETALGLMGSTSAVDNLLNNNSYKYSDIRVKTRELVYEGNETAQATFYLQSGVITNYSFQAAVGQTPRSSFTMEATDLGLGTGTFGVAAPNDLFALSRPQDITVPQLTGIFGVEEAHVQSFSVSLPLNRTSLTRLGDNKPFSRELSSPVIASLQMSAILSQFRSTKTGALDVTTDSDDMNNLTCGDFLDEDMEFIVYQASCDQQAQKTTELIKFTAKKPYVDSVNYSNSVGGFTSVDVQLSVVVSPVDEGFGHSSSESNLVIS